jgi:hypothetical protein
MLPISKRQKANAELNFGQIGWPIPSKQAAAFLVSILTEFLFSATSSANGG